MKRISQKIRVIMRAVLPASFYPVLASKYGQVRSCLNLGWRAYSSLQKIAKADPNTPPKSIRPPGFSHSVLIRPGTSDIIEFENVLLRGIYGCYHPKISPPLLIDAGANAGYTSFFFLERFPQSHVIALEPDQKNFELAKQNLAPYGERVQLLNQALWPVKAPLRINPSPAAHAVSVRLANASEAHDTEGIDPLSLLKLTPIPRIGIFKIDIEGAEEALFLHAPQLWLAFTDAILMEIHSAQAEKVVYEVMRSQPFSVSRYRELHVFVRR